MSSYYIDEQTREQRAALLARHHETMRRYRDIQHGSYDLFSGMPEAVQKQAEELFVQARKIKEDYTQVLPYVAVSRSPLEPSKVLFRSFDPYDFDGPWWRSDWSGLEPPPPPSYCCWTGAIAFGGEAPDLGALGVHAGPRAPYVIPRLLELEGMVAVVSRLEMAIEATAYVVTYYAQPRPVPELLTAPWKSPTYLYRTQLGRVRWRECKETLDFDLDPWLERGKLKWCLPGDEEARLSDEAPLACPFRGLA